MAGDDMIGMIHKWQSKDFDRGYRTALGGDMIEWPSELRIREFPRAA
jgi:hypothetical protein